MKDVLQYSEQQLREMSTDELNELYEQAENMESLYNTTQLVEKTLINSLYGALGNKKFPLFNEKMAGAITGNGRYFIQKLARNIEKDLQALLPSDNPYMVYGDTDSIYFQIEPFMKKIMEKNPGLSINEYVELADQFEKKVIEPIVQKTITEFSDELNAFNRDMIRCEREIIADAAVFCAKKKYYARVRDSEGTRFPEDDPYIKVMGLEIIKSSTPAWSKKYLKQAIPHILDKNENQLKLWFNEVKQEFINTDLNEIAHSGGVSRIDYGINDKGVPIGSRAAIRHNMYIKQNNLDNKYAPIQPGDKCRRLFLTEPNPFNSNIVAYTNDMFASEISKHDCVDYDTQFEKQFLSPLSLMVSVLNYNLEKETDVLDDW